ncbi:hypothetical protein [Roseofilum capinflatum]|uniref:DUF2993 domain-containing protein n=1 Tax=Roseofilum capinflatum BLCC-M114 TaxID=3022440 RepID=A0ABT7B0R9_9CYAN|nr:hypothetical protein [Roseofilum capinflatum]MDJ1172769.1 hypothetical protein [Roseofilum capinflatum BLCC-M114]
MKRGIGVAAILGLVLVSVGSFPLLVSNLRIGDLPVLAQVQPSANLMEIALREQAKVVLVNGSQKSGRIVEMNQQTFFLGWGNRREEIPWSQVASVEFEGDGIMVYPVGEFKIRGEGGPRIRLWNVPLQALGDSPEGNLVVDLRAIPGIAEDEIVEFQKLMNQFQYVVDMIKYDLNQNRMVVELTGYEKPEEESLKP